MLPSWKIWIAHLIRIRALQRAHDSHVGLRVGGYALVAHGSALHGCMLKPLATWCWTILRH